MNFKLLPFQFSQPSFINLNILDINMIFMFTYTIKNTQFINEKKFILLKNKKKKMIFLI